MVSGAGQAGQVAERQTEHDVDKGAEQREGKLGEDKDCGEQLGKNYRIVQAGNPRSRCSLHLGKNLSIKQASFIFMVKDIHCFIQVECILAVMIGLTKHFFLLLSPA